MCDGIAIAWPTGFSWHKMSYVYLLCFAKRNIFVQLFCQAADRLTLWKSLFPFFILYPTFSGTFVNITLLCLISFVQASRLFVTVCYLLLWLFLFWFLYAILKAVWLLYTVAIICIHISLFISFLWLQIAYLHCFCGQLDSQPTENVIYLLALFLQKKHIFIRLLLGGQQANLSVQSINLACLVA